MILDLSFKLHLENGGLVYSVNNTMEKWAPRGAIDQLGHSLKRLIDAFAEANDDAVILMAKWDIQDGFLQLNWGKNGSFVTYGSKNWESCVALWYPPPCRWAGWNLHRIFVQHLKWLGT